MADWSWCSQQPDEPMPGWHKSLARSAPSMVCWERDGGTAAIYLVQGEGEYTAADRGGWVDGLYDSFAEAAAACASR